jgi:hypothetical protein
MYLFVLVASNLRDAVRVGVTPNFVAPGCIYD